MFKRIIAVMFFVGLVASSVFAQVEIEVPTRPAKKPTQPAKKPQKKSYTVVISTTFDYAKSFSEGLAFVRIDRNFVYIDKTGKVVIPDASDIAESFSEGLACVRINGKCGYIKYNK